MGFQLCESSSLEALEEIMSEFLALLFGARDEMTVVQSWDGHGEVLLRWDFPLYFVDNRVFQLRF